MDIVSSLASFDFTATLTAVRRRSGKIGAWAGSHKFITLIVIATVVYGAYYEYGKLTSTAGETSYIVATVDTGTIISSVTGTGQVSASNQLDVKPKVSGEAISVPVKAGEQVGAGEVLAYIDSTSARQNVRDAQANLQSAQISLAKLKEATDPATLTQYQNNLQNATDNLAKAYSDAYNDVTATYLDFPVILTGLQDINTGTQAARGSQWNIDYYKNSLANWSSSASIYRDSSYNGYMKANSAYQSAFVDYHATSQTSPTTTIEAILAETYATTQTLSDGLNGANAFLQYYEDQVKAHSQNPSATADTGLANLNTYIGKTNAHLAALLGDINSIKSYKQQMTQTSQSLAKLQAGADSLDLQSAELAVTQRQNALDDAQTSLSDYAVRAPFSGTISTLSVLPHQQIGGSSIATIITDSKVAQISLNEVDAAKIAIGNKATLTFDALPDLTIAGVVSQMDSVGTVSQGVVTYTVKISFESNDDRVRPGMSVSAAIITDVKQDVIVVPSSAVKSSGGSSYVLVFDPALPTDATSTAQGIPSKIPPQQITVTTGVTNDTETEITSGLTAGMQIVTRTITAQTTTSGSAPSILGAATGNRAGGATGGGAARALGR